MQKKGGGFYGARGGRKPLLALMRGKVQTRAEETEMKVTSPHHQQSQSLNLNNATLNLQFRVSYSL